MRLMTGRFCHFVTSIKRVISALTITCLGVWLTACGQTNTPDAPPKSNESVHNAVLTSDNITANQQIIETITEAYQHALTSARELLNATQHLIDKPSPSTLESARLAWQKSHDDYLLAQVSQSLAISHPVLDSPLSEDNDVVGHTLEIRIDQYPALPGYLDSVKGYPQSGLIHAEVELSIETLLNEHQLSDTAYVALGFHALEVMLFGESTDSDARYQDFISNTQKSSVIDAAKRRQALSLLLAQQIVDDLALRAEAWRSEDGYYRKFILTLANSTLQDMLRTALETEQNTQQTRSEHVPSEIIGQRLQFLERLLVPNETSDKATPEEK